MKQSVLVVDDCKAIHVLIAELLSHDDVTIRAATDATTGLAMAQAWRPDLLVLDIDMPGVDGFEMFRRLNAWPAMMHVPVIFLTSMSGHAERLRGLQLGATEYLTKPFDPDELVARVRNELRRQAHVNLVRSDRVRAFINGALTDSPAQIAA